MAREKKKEEIKPGAPEYMNTYGDMITLMLTFFVMLFAMSDVNKAKFEALAQSFYNIPIIGVESVGNRDHLIDLLGSGVMQMPSLMEIPEADSREKMSERAQQAQQELKQMASDFQTYFAENNMLDMFQVEIKDYYIMLTLPDQVLFDKSSASLKPEALEILDMVMQKLNDYADSDIEVEGHTDSDPINTPQYPSNWELSSSRANAVGRYMIEAKGFDPHRILAVGRGEFYPVAPNDTPENKAKNRRVEIRVKSTFFPAVTALYMNRFR